MIASLAQRAEVLKLARLLGRPVAEFEFLHKLDATVIRQLREQATASLFDADRKLFQRVASASRLLPVPVTALIAEKAMGPLLCARTTGLLPPERAVEISRRLHTPFLADLCVELDPRSAHEVLAAMPNLRVGEVAQELSRRGEYITMARFVDCLGDEAIRDTMEQLDDDEALLRIGFFVEDDSRLSTIIDLLPRERLRNIMRVAAHGDAELWPEALSLINRVAEPPRRQMADLAAELEQDAIARMIASTQAQQLWAAMLPVVLVMGTEQQRRLINLPPIQDPAVLAAVIDAATTAGLWPQVLPVVAMMEPAVQQRLARLPGLQREQVLAAIIRAADGGGLWQQLLPLVAVMDNAGQAQAARVAESLGPDVVERISAALRQLVSPAVSA